MAALALASLGAAPAQAAPSAGIRDHSYAPLSGSPSGSKPESKLWFNHGWWASMFSPGAGTYHIFRLNLATGAWADTGVAIDDRKSTKADALWDAASSKLYVASHIAVTKGASASAGSSARLYRYSYLPASNSYALDAGFPVTINAAKSETLVIDKDSTGTLWATWTQRSRVYVNHSVGSDAGWGKPFALSGTGSKLSSDDISSAIHFGANKIGVMWSNQSQRHVYFSIHADGAGDGAWSTETVPSGASADDHINLKADSAGRVFAAVKTSESTKTRPLTLLLVRSALGQWSTAPFGTVADSNTRPIVLLDEQHGAVHMFATCPQPPKASGQSGGDICEKTALMATPSFAPGIGTPVIADGASAGMNDATSTKQNVDWRTGIVVLADNAKTRTYWHFQESLGLAPAAAPPPAAPPAAAAPSAARPTPCQTSFVGTAAADRLTGTQGPDRLFGLARNDFMRGRGGDDCLFGGPGNDRMLAGAGSDVVVGNSGNDHGAGQTGNDRVIGNHGRDRLTGGAGDDRVSGGAGSDLLLGGPGNDRLFGGPGGDRISVGRGRNVVYAGPGRDTINARNGSQDLIVCGRAADTVRADRIDVLRGCERVIRGGRRT